MSVSNGIKRQEQETAITWRLSRKFLQSRLACIAALFTGRCGIVTRDLHTDVDIISSHLPHSTTFESTTLEIGRTYYNVSNVLVYIH